MTEHEALVPTLVEIARIVADEARTLIVDGRHRAAIHATKSSAVDIVTQMDLAAERLIRERLHELRPHDGVLGEEGDDTHGTSDVTWVVDPIDGTVNYLYGLPHFGVSIAAVAGPPLTTEWTALAGAVADGSGRTWWAGAGIGAFCDGERLVRDDAPALDGTLLATGFQYLASRRAIQGEIVARVLPHVRDIRRLGAAAIDLCHVAAGQVDAYYEHGLNAWDLAAGALIATEAGVRVGGIDGDAADEHLLIAAHPGVWDQLRDALVSAGARDPFAAVE